MIDYNIYRIKKQLRFRDMDLHKEENKEKLLRSKIIKWQPLRSQIEKKY
jgi:hypothetical protein